MSEHDENAYRRSPYDPYNSEPRGGRGGGHRRERVKAQVHERVSAFKDFSPYVDEEAGEGERNYAVILHITSLLPWGGFVIALVMWLVRRESPFLDDHGKEIVNFHITQFLLPIIAGILGLVLIIMTIGIGAIVVVPLAAVLGFLWYIVVIVASIRGAIAASNGQYYRYPMTIRMIG